MSGELGELVEQGVDGAWILLQCTVGAVVGEGHCIVETTLAGTVGTFGGISDILGLVVTVVEEEAGETLVVLGGVLS